MVTGRLLILWATVLIQILGYHKVSGTNESIIENYQNLLDHFMAKPVVKYKMPAGISGTEPLDMSFSLMVLDVYDIDEIRQAITVVAQLSVEWDHTELSWNASEFNDVGRLYVDRDVIWSPQIYVILGQENSINLELQNTLIVLSTGTVKSDRPYYISFSCEINFKKYPFDTQSCDIGFSVQGVVAPTRISNKFDSAITDIITGEWTLLSVTHRVDNIGENGPGLDIPWYTFTVQRQPNYYIVTIIFPMVVQSAITPLVFLVPAHSGEKMSYLVAVFTSVAIFLNFISDVMPRSLPDLPYLAMLLIEVLVEGFLAMLATLIVTHMHYQEEKVRKADANSILNRKIHPIPIRLNQDPKSVVVGKEKQRDNRFKQDGPRKPNRITAQCLDFVFFFAFVLSQVIFLLALFAYSDWLTDFQTK